MKQGSRFSPLIALSVLAILFASLASAGDVTPAKPRTTVSPKFLKSGGVETGTVEIEAKVNRFGIVTGARAVSGHDQEAIDACLSAIVRWKFDPARKNGTAVDSTIVQPFEFNPGVVSLKKKRDPFSQAPAAYKRVKPEIADQYRNVNGQLSFRVDLDAEGRIESIALKETTHPELVATTRAALEKWKFSPAFELGQPVPSKVLVPFNIVANPETRERTIQEAYDLNKVDVEPKVIARHDPVLPVALEKEQGEAWMLLYIDEYGYVAQADTLKSSSREMARLAESAVRQWKYKPAVKGDKTVPSKLAVPFRSSNGVLVAQVAADRNPKPIKKRSPKLPAELSKKNGYVRVLLELDESGNVVAASAHDSSDTALNAPAVKAAEGWKFKPATRDGKPVASSLILPFVFGKS